MVETSLLCLKTLSAQADPFSQLFLMHKAQAHRAHAQKVQGLSVQLQYCCSSDYTISGQNQIYLHYNRTHLCLSWLALC